MSDPDRDLVVDRIYGGSRQGNAADDPLPGLLGVSLGGGFRYIGDRSSLRTLRLVVLKTAFNDPDWPDRLDQETGLFTYYGDNKKPGRALHDTHRGGNRILSRLFSGRHDPGVSDEFPVVLLFGRADAYRDVHFLGLAVPGSADRGPDDDLVAVWRTAATGERFQNYRATFTVLDVSTVSQDWIADVRSGQAAQSVHAPQPWLDWLHHRRYRALVAPHSIEIRSRDQQQPRDRIGQEILKVVFDQFKEQPHAFEACAVELVKLMMPAAHSVDLTRPWRDGGRDAIGRYRVGNRMSGIDVDFALEAKCYDPAGGGVGVRELSRLISRLRYRQFGVLVTTSWLGSQAYKELKDDAHPVVVISGADIVELLQEKVGALASIRSWLAAIGDAKRTSV